MAYILGHERYFNIYDLFTKRNLSLRELLSQNTELWKENQLEFPVTHVKVLTWTPSIKHSVRASMLNMWLRREGWLDILSVRRKPEKWVVTVNVTVVNPNPKNLNKGHYIIRVHNQLHVGIVNLIRTYTCIEMMILRFATIASKKKITQRPCRGELGRWRWRGNLVDWPLLDSQLSLPLPPRSPNPSVFSVANHYSSTAHLRPTSSFALTPPPIHKGRRLRIVDQSLKASSSWLIALYTGEAPLFGYWCWGRFTAGEENRGV